MILFLQFQKRYDNEQEEDDSQQRKSCVCVVLRPATDGTLFHVRGELSALQAASTRCLRKLSLGPPLLFSFFFPFFLYVPVGCEMFQRGVGLLEEGETGRKKSSTPRRSVRRRTAVGDPAYCTTTTTTTRKKKINIGSFVLFFFLFWERRKAVLFH